MYCLTLNIVGKLDSDFNPSELQQKDQFGKIEMHVSLPYEMLIE